MYSDAMKHPFEVAVENLPKVFMKMMEIERIERRKRKEEIEDKANETLGKPKIEREFRSDEIIKDLLRSSGENGFVDYAATVALNSRFGKPFFKIASSINDWIDDAREETEKEINRTINKMQASDHGIFKKFGKAAASGKSWM
jgi:hypothetical protein